MAATDARATCALARLLRDGLDDSFESRAAKTG